MKKWSEIIWKNKLSNKKIHVTRISFPSNYKDYKHLKILKINDCKIF